MVGLFRALSKDLCLRRGFDICGDPWLVEAGRGGEDFVFDFDVTNTNATMPMPNG